MPAFHSSTHESNVEVRLRSTTFIVSFFSPQNNQRIFTNTYFYYLFWNVKNPLKRNLTTKITKSDKTKWLKYYVPLTKLTVNQSLFPLAFIVTDFFKTLFIFSPDRVAVQTHIGQKWRSFSVDSFDLTYFADWATIPATK